MLGPLQTARPGPQLLIQYESREIVSLREEREQALAAGDQTRADQLGLEIVGRLDRMSKERLADLKLQTNEQTKYSATFVNGVATAIFSAGVATPVIGIFAPGSPYAANPLLLGEVSGGCILVATVLHLIVRQMLRRLRA